MLRSRAEIIARAIAAVAVFALLFGPAAAQDNRRNIPGQFDFYVLALSWSPSFCAEAGERGDNRNGMQCGERPYSFIVHGLWPQYERGFPRDCQVPAPRLSRDIVNSMLDLTPAPRLVFSQWDRHGTCTGLPARAYFDTVRRAREKVKIPDEYQALQQARTVKPDEVETAFIRANPGLTPGAVAVACDARRLREVRICLSKDLDFRDCAEVDRRSCRRDGIIMPPVRAPRSGAAAGDATKG